MTTGIDTFIANLNPECTIIKDQAVKYFDNNSKIRDDGAAQIFRRPWVAPQNFGLLLFPTADRAWFAEFQKRTGRTIPEIYQDILLNMNGCFVYDFALYGPPKTIYSTGHSNRSVLQQYDLTTANINWIKEYDIDQNLFHIGGRLIPTMKTLAIFLKTTKYYQSGKMEKFYIPGRQ